MNDLRPFDEIAKELIRRMHQDVLTLLNSYFPYGKVGVLPINKAFFQLFSREMGVYFLCSENNEILYIGESIGVGNRIAGHISKYKDRGISKVKIIRLPTDTSEYDRLGLEARLIHRFHPKHNQKNPFFRCDCGLPKMVNIIEVIHELNNQPQQTKPT